MIAYDLECANGHTFEGWFEDLKGFEEQNRHKLIACPVCNDTSVGIVPSTFAIKTNSPPQQESVEHPVSEDQMYTHQIMNFLEKNFEDVGPNFTREALKMHYDVCEKRNIRGTSTEAEEKTLEKEGIKFFRFPVPHLDS